MFLTVFNRDMYTFESRCTFRNMMKRLQTFVKTILALRTAENPNQRIPTLECKWLKRQPLNSLNKDRPHVQLKTSTGEATLHFTLNTNDS